MQLRGVPVSALQAVYDERLRLNPGVETLIAACKRAGLRCILVSGGFTFLPTGCSSALAWMTPDPMCSRLKTSA